ncbi:hypothetical protein [Brevundimonas sp.]|uniref:hypothetical protein n=1 Tax=Brevundimonas sp. TaxID=1871086 RepID=UPI002D676D27|nr:hypothetical protein [Brevundimonas sp.]HYD27685.1 hypothetical protein [Brevundimonas sp.]
MTAHIRHIRLELAREPAHPNGDASTGYDIVAFLDDEGRLDTAACRDQSDRCRVRRFEHDATAATGQLRHTTGDRWLLDFPGGDREDATGFRLGEERFVPGEYVSIIAGDGATHTYLVERVAEL